MFQSELNYKSYLCCLLRKGQKELSKSVLRPECKNQFHGNNFKGSWTARVKSDKAEIRKRSLWYCKFENQRCDPKVSGSMWSYFCVSKAAKGVSSSGKDARQKSLGRIVLAFGVA